MQKVFNSYSDPAHGWIKVPRKVLRELGIEGQVTHYSYERGEDVYLEEDCDATLLVETMRKLGIEPKFRHNSSNKMSKIRTYENYSPRTPEVEREMAELRTRLIRRGGWSRGAIRLFNSAGIGNLRYWAGLYGV